MGSPNDHFVDIRGRANVLRDMTCNETYPARQNNVDTVCPLALRSVPKEYARCPLSFVQTRAGSRFESSPGHEPGLFLGVHTHLATFQLPHVYCEVDGTIKP